MKKENMQTHKALCLMQKLDKGGWRKKAKKALAGVLAGAMVLTSGIVVPQNVKTAEAATIETLVGNGWWNDPPTSTHHTLTGDGSVSFYVGVVEKVEDDYGSFAAFCIELNHADTNYITSTSAFDIWGVGEATENIEFEGRDEEAWAQPDENHLYQITVTRTGDNFTIAYFDVTDNTEYHTFTATNAPMGEDVDVYAMAQVGTIMVSSSVIPSHTVTVNYLNEDGTKVAESVTKQVLETVKYSISSPDVKGYMPDQFTVAGTMGTEDIELTVNYHSVPEHLVTIKYVYEDGTTAAESIMETVDEGKNYSFSSPFLIGYEPDYLKISGTMGTKDEPFTVTYTKREIIATVSTEPWTDFKDAYKINKTGDFNITYNFHSYVDTEREEFLGIQCIFYLTMTTNLEEESLSNTDWCVRPGISESTFSGLGDPDPDVSFSNNIYNDGFDNDSFLETILDAEMTVNVVRTGTTIAVNIFIKGANEREYSETITAINCPTGAMNIFLNTWDKFHTIDIYSVTDKEGGSVSVHYVHEDGSEAAPDEDLGWIDKGQSYSVDSPEIDGYVADQPVVSGVMGNDRVEVTVTYTKAPQASEEPTETPIAPTETPAEPTAEPSTEPTETPAAPTVEPSTEPTETPAAPTVEPSTEPTTAPTTTPSETPKPTKAPTVSKGDKVTASNATYKVTSTKDKSVTYTNTSNKNSKKTSVTVPKTVKVTSGGKQVTYKVTTVAKGAFKNNDSVKKITIGENITKIEANAFKGCDNLTTIVIKSKKLTSVGNNALKGTSKKLVIKVPAKKLNAYTKLFSGKGNKNVTVKKA